jgi:cyanophycin synthetase
MGSHGKGITVGVDTEEKLESAIRYAKQIYPESDVLVQEQFQGEDLRILIIDGEMVAATRRVPAQVHGNGVSTVLELIRAENNNGSRTSDYSDKLCKINEEKAVRYLGDGINAIPRENEVVQVVGTANIGSGGHAEDVTDDVPSAISDDAVRLANALGAFVCGVDFLYDRQSNRWILLEANTSPSFGLHLHPTLGSPRAVDEKFVDALLK